MDKRYQGRLAALAAAVILAACGGSGGGSDTTTAGGGGGGGGGGDTPTPQTTAVAVTVIDGALKGATVCLDLNKSGTCDAGEPTAVTDANGAATLQVAPADAGKYPVLAVVGTDAVDADNGPVTTAFILKAPANKPAIVTPLTTLVQTHVEASGASTDAAEAAVQQQIGLNVSLFQDFSKSTTAEGATLNAIARVVVLTTQEQTKAVASTIGQKAIDGSTITQKSVNDLVQRKLLEILPAVVTQLSAPAVQAAIASKDPAQLTSALAPVVTSASNATGITSSSVGTLVGIANQSQTGAGETVATGPTASLNQLNFTNADNWLQRLFTSSAAQNTADANGITRANERRSRKFSNGITAGVAHWSFGGNPSNQSDLHWNGSKWVACGLQDETLSGTRDAEGRATYNYCDNFDAGSSTRAAFDVSGKTMLEVYNQARGAGFTNLNIANAASALGSETFPANSKLFYQTNTPLTTAVAYSPLIGSEMRVFSAGVAAGKTSPTDTTAPCNAITSAAVADSSSTPATTLETLVARYPGSPCVNPEGTIQVGTTSGPVIVSSGPRNEWWGNSTLSYGIIGNAQVGATQPATSASFYTTNTLLRLAFAAGNVVKYYSCQQRATDGSPRNCNQTGTGSYSVATLGDARILTMTNTPPQAAALQERVYVERGGKVYSGYRNRATPNSSARLNLAAANALLAKLGMEAVDPSTPFAFTKASYQGDWLIRNAADSDPLVGTTLRIFPTYSGGSDYQCIEPVNGPFECALTLDESTGHFTLVDTQSNDGLLEGSLNMATGQVNATFTPTVGPAETIVGGRR